MFSISYSQQKTIELSHYLFPEFTKGVVLMKNGIKNEALLNYNSVTEEMIFEDKGKKLAIGKEERELVDTVFIKDRKFIPLNNKFLEILYDSNCDLYVEHICSIIPPGQPAAYGGVSYTSATTTYSSFTTEGMIYELKLPDGFVVVPHTNYWLRKNGELKKFLNIRQLMKLYDDKKDLFKASVKEYDVKYDNQKSIVLLVARLCSSL